MNQWVMNISRFADRLIAGLDNIDWPNSTKEIQKELGQGEAKEQSNI